MAVSARMMASCMASVILIGCIGNDYSIRNRPPPTSPRGHEPATGPEPGVVAPR